MHAFLSRHLPPRWAALGALVWYLLLMAGIVICYQGRGHGFLYLHL